VTFPLALLPLRFLGWVCTTPISDRLRIATGVISRSRIQSAIDRPKDPNGNFDSGTRRPDQAFPFVNAPAARGFRPIKFSAGATNRTTAESRPAELNFQLENVAGLATSSWKGLRHDSVGSDRDDEKTNMRSITPPCAFCGSGEVVTTDPTAFWW